jgi:hypothetical protein
LLIQAAKFAVPGQALNPNIGVITNQVTTILNLARALFHQKLDIDPA